MNKVCIIPEADEQAILFEYAAWKSKSDPRWGLIMAIPNGGYRLPKTAKELKRQGVKAGYPDMQLDVAAGGYFGLKIELKNKGGGRLSAEQREWLRVLNENGYRAVVCLGWREAVDEIARYLAL